MDLLTQVGLGFIIGGAMLVAYLAYRAARELIAAWLEELGAAREDRRRQRRGRRGQ